MAKPPKDVDSEPAEKPGEKAPAKTATKAVAKRTPRKRKATADTKSKVGTKSQPAAAQKSATRTPAKKLPKATALVEPVEVAEKPPVFEQALSGQAAKTAGLWADGPSADGLAAQAAAEVSPQLGQHAKSPSPSPSPAASSHPNTSEANADEAPRSRTGKGFAAALKAIPLPALKIPRTLGALRPRWSWVDAWAATLTPTFNALAHFRVIAAACIAIIAVTAFVPGFTTIPPLDRDESRFSQATRQMVATGDYVDIRFQNGARYQKPIGIYWLQSVAVNLYGAEDGQAPIWVYRTVSFVGAVAAALLVYWLALAFGAPPVAFSAGVLVALTILLGAEARLAKTDAMLFATILLAQGVLARAFMGKRDSAVKGWHAAVFWIACAAGILIKGPILLLVVGSTAVAASLLERRMRWLRRLRPGLGFMGMLVLVLPWFIAIGITSAGEFYEQSIGRDFLEKIGTSRERPFVPPGVFTFGFFPGLGWPLAPFAFMAIPFAIASWHDKSTRFLVAWIVPTLLVFEFSATKLPHYILPIYPALAILAARMVVYEKLPTGWLAWVGRVLFLLVPVAAVIGIPVVLFVFGESISPLGTLLALVGLLFILGAFFLIMRSQARASVVLTVVGTLFIYAGTFAFHVPAARTIWITPQLVATLDSVQCDNPQLATLGYNEPSLILMTRTDLRILATPQAAGEFLAEGGCRAAFIDQPFVDEVFEELAASQGEAGLQVPSVRLISRVEGLNINGGDELNLHVFAAGE
jgi:4-amino-4-deoxy-L-arabinose transferase-like glycosyltransferase